MDTSPNLKPGAKCRFCEAAPAARMYLAAPTVVALGRIVALIGDLEWEACATCSTMIDQNHWEDLAQHVFESWSKELRAKGLYLDFEEGERFRRAIRHAHAAIREAMGRTA